MADIIDFKPRQKPALEKPSIERLSSDSVEEITAQWEKSASNNRLNEYFTLYTPAWSQPGVNYLDDLTALSVVEQKIGLEPQIIAPGFGIDNPLGWVAAFRMNGIIVATPFMMSETYARAFNVLLFLKLKREMTALKIVIV